MRAADSHPLPPVGAEGRQTDGGPGWAEQHRLMMVAGDGRFAIAVAVGIHHRPRVHHAASSHGAGPAAWFDCVVFEPDAAPVVIVDHRIPVPDDRWELRTSGLWADHICETPFRHWSYGLEAFGLAIDDGREMLGRGYGSRVPLGWELEFESEPRVLGPVGEGPEPGYGQRGRVHGLLLFAGRSEPVDGTAVRQHHWGPLDRAPIGALDRQANRVLNRIPDGAVAGSADDGASQEVALPVPGAVCWLSRSGTGLTARTEPAPTDQR